MVWKCGDRVLASSSKYHLKQEGTTVELVIYKLQGADSGEYSCDTGDQRTSAVLTVQGRSCLRLFTHPLESRLSACPTSLLSMNINLSSGDRISCPTCVLHFSVELVHSSLCACLWSLFTNINTPFTFSLTCYSQ